jgi:hypothetical protein
VDDLKELAEEQDEVENPAPVDKVELLVRKMQRRKTAIIAAIRKSQGAPPNLADLAKTLAELEGLEARAAVADKARLEAVAVQAYGVGSVWAQYLRGHCCMLLKTVLGLANDGLVAQYLKRINVHVKVSATTVFYSLLYFRMCRDYPALLWSGVGYTAVVQNAAALEANADFKALMKELASVVAAARRRAAKGMMAKTASQDPRAVKSGATSSRGRR